MKKHCLCHCGCNLSSLDAPDVHRFAPNKILENLAFFACFCRLSAALLVCCLSSSSLKVHLTLGAMTRMLCSFCCGAHAGYYGYMQHAFREVERSRAVAALPPRAQTQNPSSCTTTMPPCISRPHRDAHHPLSFVLAAMVHPTHALW